MSSFAAIALALLVLASLWVLASAIIPMGSIVDQDHGPRVTRLILWRGLRAMAVWEVTVGLVLVSMGNWTNCIALFGMGGILWMTASAKRRGLM